MTTLIAALKFVQGAVAKKSPLPILTHFSIRGNLVKGYNGAITICSPIPLDLDCQPKATPFVKAIQACDDTVHLALTATGRLTVKSGKFKSHVECSTEEFPDAEPAGEFYKLEPGFIEALKILEPLIAEDASRPWARSIMMRDGCFFATNNVAVIQYWVGHQLPRPICISHLVVNELIRIKEDPVYLQADDHSVTFHYSENRWLKAQIVTDQWPDVDRVLARESNQQPISDELLLGLNTVAPFTNDSRDVWFTQHGVATSLEEGSGASYTIPGWNTPIGWFDIDILSAVIPLAQTFDFSLYPAPVLFFGKDGALRGAIAGKKDANYPPQEA